MGCRVPHARAGPAAVRGRAGAQYATADLGSDNAKTMAFCLERGIEAMTSMQLEFPDGHTALAFEQQIRGACFIKVAGRADISDRGLRPRYPIGFMLFLDPLDSHRFDPGAKDQGLFITKDGAYDTLKMRQLAGPTVFTIQWRSTDEQLVLTDQDREQYRLSELVVDFGTSSASGQVAEPSAAGVNRA